MCCLQTADMCCQKQKRHLQISLQFDDTNPLKRVQRPAAFAIVCFCFCEFRKVSYSGSCAEEVADFMQSILVFVLPLSS